MPNPCHPGSCHPGQILYYFLDGRSTAQIAAHLAMPDAEVAAILDGTGSISAEMALRLAEAFQTEPDLWLRLQMQHDLWLASKKKRVKVKPLETGIAA
jgi:addiction module HigA family antidote